MRPIRFRNRLTTPLISFTLSRYAAATNAATATSRRGQVDQRRQGPVGQAAAHQHDGQQRRAGRQRGHGICMQRVQRGRRNVGTRRPNRINSASTFSVLAIVVARAMPPRPRPPSAAG